jgi:hypothetical protein
VVVDPNHDITKWTNCINWLKVINFLKNILLKKLKNIYFFTKYFAKKSNKGTFLKNNRGKVHTF